MNHNQASKSEYEIVLSLCMIVRDNVRTIQPCLESIRPWVDEMIIVDTGSKDRTAQIVETFGAQLYHFEWIDDFSAARNESISHANGRWIFWMDSDDTISPECGQKLRHLADASHHDNVMGFVMQVRCPAANSGGIDEFTVVDQVKMFRNREDIRFEGRIHEQVLMPIRLLGGEVEWTDIFVVHSGSEQCRESQQRKTDRDLRILHKDLTERPNHPFVLFNFAMTYAEIGEYENALGWIDKCLAASQSHESHVAKAYAYQANCLFQLNRLHEALTSCQQGRQYYPNDPELLFREGMIRHALGQYEDSITRYREVLKFCPGNTFRSTDPGIEGFKCRFNLGVVYRDANRLAEAELQWRQVLDDRPSYLPACRALGDLLLSCCRFNAAEVYADEMVASDKTRCAGLLLRALIFESQGNSDAATEVLEQCLQQYPQDETVLEENCRFFFFHQDWEKTLELLEVLLELNPANGAALHNLGAVLLQKGEDSKAAAALEKSLEVRPESEETKRLLNAART